MKSFKQRFEEKIMVIDGMEDACHLWTAQLDKNTYGQFTIHKVGKFQAHRLAYEMYVGPIPAGKVVMHICDRPRCVNPAHLRLGTHADNIQDMISKGRGRWQNYGDGCPTETHCRHGHEWANNTYITPSGRRQCRKCNLVNAKKYQSRKKKNND